MSKYGFVKQIELIDRKSGVAGKKKILSVIVDTYYLDDRKIPYVRYDVNTLYPFFCGSGKESREVLDGLLEGKTLLVKYEVNATNPTLAKSVEPIRQFSKSEYSSLFVDASGNVSGVLASSANGEVIKIPENSSSTVKRVDIAALKERPEFVKEAMGTSLDFDVEIEVDEKKHSYAILSITMDKLKETLRMDEETHIGIVTDYRPKELTYIYHNFSQEPPHRLAAILVGQEDGIDTLVGKPKTGRDVLLARYILSGMVDYNPKFQTDKIGKDGKSGKKSEQIVFPERAEELLFIEKIPKTNKRLQYVQIDEKQIKLRYALDDWRDLMSLMQADSKNEATPKGDKSVDGYLVDVVNQCVKNLEIDVDEALRIFEENRSEVLNFDNYTLNMVRLLLRKYRTARPEEKPAVREDFINAIDERIKLASSKDELSEDRLKEILSLMFMKLNVLNDECKRSEDEPVDELCDKWIEIYQKLSSKNSYVSMHKRVCKFKEGTTGRNNQMIDFNQDLYAQADIDNLICKGDAKTLVEIAYYGKCEKDIEEELGKAIRNSEINTDNLINNIHKLYAEDETEYSEFPKCFNDAINKFKIYNEELNGIYMTSNLSKGALQYLSYLNRPEYFKWNEGEVAVDGMRELFRYFENYKRVDCDFLTLSRILKKGIAKCDAILSEIDEEQTPVAKHLYSSFIKKYKLHLIERYGDLCSFSAPLLRLRPGVALMERLGNRVYLNITVENTFENVQPAQNIHLVMIPNDEVKAPNEDQEISKSLMYLDKGLTAPVEIKLTSDAPGIRKINVIIKYSCIRDVVIDESCEHGYREIIDECPEVPPTSVKFIVESNKQKLNAERKELMKHRIGQFDADGSRLDTEDAKLRKILENRKSEIDKMIKRLENVADDEIGQNLYGEGRWIMLFGQWRVGKSAILKCLTDNIKNKYNNSLICDFSVTGSPKNLEFFDDYLAAQIIQAVDLAPKNDEQEEIWQDLLEKYEIDALDDQIAWKEMCRVLEDYNKTLKDRFENGNIVLIVDEFARLYQEIIEKHTNKTILSRWLDFINQTKTLCVTAGAEFLPKLMDACDANIRQKISREIPVTYLSEENVEEYMHYILGESLDDGVIVDESLFSRESESAIRRVYELTKGNPYMLMLLGDNLIDNIIDNNVSYLTTTIITSTIDSFVKPGILDKYFYSLFNPYGETKNMDNEKDENEDDTEHIIEDDKVRDDNVLILNKIVELADRETHKCSDHILRAAMPDSIMDVFDKRKQDLIDRNVIVEDDDHRLSIYIDLYYEVVLRLNSWKGAK